MASKCSECSYCQQFNEDWCICWHPDYSGSKKPINMPCLIEIDPVEKGGDKQ